MQDWEHKYLHTLCVRNACCVSAGVEIPKDPEYGVLRQAPQAAMVNYNGEVFWKYMEGQGHDHAEYHACKCHKEAEDA